MACVSKQYEIKTSGAGAMPTAKNVAFIGL